MIIRLILIIAFLLSGWQRDLWAEFKPSPQALRSVVLLTDSKGSACASGFLLRDGRLVTASHVVQSLCNLSECPGLVIRRAASLGAPALETLTMRETPKVVLNIPWLDLAVIAGALEPGVFELAGSATPDHISFLSFPRCQDLALSQGRVKQDAVLWLDTTVEAAPGSSGGPAFDQNYNLVGVAQQATSLSQALMARLYGTSYELRFLKAQALRQRLSSIDEESIGSEIQALNEYYNKRILPLTGWDRFLQGADFISTVNSLRSPFALPPLTPRERISFLALAEYPGVPFTPTHDSAFSRLIMASNLESKGLFKKFLVPIDEREFLKDLQSSGMKAEELSEISNLLSSFRQSGFYGFDLFAIKQAAWWFLVISLFIFSIAASAGYIFALTKGSLLRRAAVTFFWGVLCWPVSILAFIIVKRRSLN